MVKSIEDFKKDCLCHRCNRHTLISPKCEKDYKQDACYKKYITKLEKPKPVRKTLKPKAKVDEEWERVKKAVWERDGGECRLERVLTPEDWEKMDSAMFFPAGEILDCAHIVSRSASPSMKYNIDDVVLMKRKYHSLIDTYKDPITGKPMDKERRNEWWIRVVGKELFERLTEEKRETTS